MLCTKAPIPAPTPVPNTALTQAPTPESKVGSSETLIDIKPLKNWISSKQLEFKVVAQKRDANNYQTDQALAIVRSFIIKKKLKTRPFGLFIFI